MLPIIVVTLLIRLIFAVRTYDLIYIMTRGGPASPPISSAISSIAQPSSA